MQGIRLTTAAAILSLMGASSVLAQSGSEPTPGDRAEEFLKSVNLIGTEIECETDPSQIFSNTSIRQVASSCGDEITLQLILEHSFLGATACDIDTALSISRTLINQKLNEIEALFDEAHQAVLAQGYADLEALNASVFERAGDLLGQAVSDEDGAHLRRAKEAYQADGADQDIVAFDYVAKLPGNSEILQSFDAQKALFQTAVNIWLLGNKDIGTEDLNAEKAKLTEMLSFIGKEENATEADRVAAAACEIERQNPGTQAGNVALFTISGLSLKK